MKKIILLFLFYCTIQGDGYFCKTVGFEIKEFPNKETFVNEKYGCFEVKGAYKWSCQPFDKGAILLEEAHECPSSIFKNNPFNLNFTPLGGN